MNRKRQQAELLQRLVAICTARGGRVTRQRRAVLERLLASGRPQTAYELRDALLPQDASITPASVYRCLDFLMGHGLAHRLETSRSFVACKHPDHDHAVQFLICRACGTVVEAEDRQLADATANLGRRLGFDVDHPTVELTGTCATCRLSDGSLTDGSLVPADGVLQR